ncbi:FAD-dependent oxidoreductase [Devosia sp. YIM 151766]|uniref:FAD-dependent oxidoreductase n=1 Tax=Devosia sp. YIM 151766 TaxID=3017325 RepID=UPI00255C6D44|nr:FAD-dependent oxidoreductase [Devosia sp. YIM 151766]WIY52175.1 FAD-dependent oxidoreductase [Devosia sp. YIM 151766]
MADQSRPDLCVVGAGALGIALAQYARRLGARVTLVDRGPPEPGDGPQQALRLAALQASAARAHAIRHAAALGLGEVEPKISMKAVRERASAAALEQAPMVDRDRLTALGIDIVRGAFSFIDQNSLLVGDIQVRPRSIILALGASCPVPAIPGLDQIDYFTPDTILDNNRKLTHLLVIGGDAAAFSLAQIFARLGSEVTLVPQGAALPDYDQDLAAILLTTLAGEGIRILDGARIEEIVPRSQGTGALVELSSGEREALDISHVLVSQAGHADLEALMPEKARLRPGRDIAGQYALGPLGQTSNRRIRVVGAAAGIDQWHHAISHGRAVVETLLLGSPVAKLAPQPRLVPTDPPLAQIGMLPANNGKALPGHHLLRASLVENEQARALGGAQGLAKALIAPNGNIAGAGFVGPGAAEMAAMSGVAMEKNIALAALAHLSLPHPSLIDSLAGLGESAAFLKPVPLWTRRWRAARRRLLFWRK